MNLLHDSSEPDDPIVTSALLWLICFPLAMGIETVRSLRLRRLERGEPAYSAYSAARSTSTQTS
jgi:hypothetical protein